MKSLLCTLNITVDVTLHFHVCHDRKILYEGAKYVQSVYGTQ